MPAVPAATPPPPPPVPDYEGERQAQAGERQAQARTKLEEKLRKKMGSKQTILTSSLGDTSLAPTEKKDLLGE